MATILGIAQLGNPILREKAHAVRSIADKDIQILMDDMLATVRDVNGLGLAAPQVSRGETVFIIASHPNPRYPQAPLMEPKAIINPKIVGKSEEIARDWEGCLSIPGIRGYVPRPETIEVEYFDRDGQKQVEALNGLIGRIFQHEYDHLQGIVFLDRLDDNKDIITDKEYFRIISTKE